MFLVLDLVNFVDTLDVVLDLVDTLTETLSGGAEPVTSLTLAAISTRQV